MTPAGVFHYSPLDSSRFGIRVKRGSLPPECDVASVVDAVEADDADLVIFRVPAGETALPTALQQRGHSVIHADTLVYYSIDLAQPVHACAERQVQRAQEHHRREIAEIAAAGFRDYRSHYAANPLLPSDLVLSGYVEWAQSRVARDGANGETWVVNDQGKVAGFATCDVSAGSVEIVLNAVHPDHERRGLYGMLLRHIQHDYSQRGLTELVISTQIWNYGVQRQWSRAGLRLFKAYDTYHLDRRLVMGIDRS